MKLLVPDVSEIFLNSGNNPSVVIRFDDSTSLFGIQLIVTNYVYRPSRGVYNKWSYNTEPMGIRVHIRYDNTTNDKNRPNGDTQLMVIRSIGYTQFITKFKNKSMTQEDLILLVDKLNSNAILHKRLAKCCFKEF